jgi:hypothetical protein
MYMIMNDIFAVVSSVLLTVLTRMVVRPVHFHSIAKKSSEILSSHLSQVNIAIINRFLISKPSQALDHVATPRLFISPSTNHKIPHTTIYTNV